MAQTSLSPELAELAGALAAAFAQCPKVISAKARIGLFYQNPEATNLFRKVQEYGEQLRNKHMEGMPPSEAEIAKFDELRQAVVDNEHCKGFLEARQLLDDMLGTVNQYLCLAIDKGSAPSDAEVAEAMNQQMSACCGGGGCHGHCDDCDSDCEKRETSGNEDHECCGKHGEGDHECCGKHKHGEGDHECCGKHKHGEGDHECCGKHKHGEGDHECCGKHGEGEGCCHSHRDDASRS